MDPLCAILNYPSMNLRKGIANFSCFLQNPIPSSKNILKNFKILLNCTEPYTIQKKHIEKLQKEIAHTNILLVEGEMFSWYGSCILYSTRNFLQLEKMARILLLPPMEFAGNNQGAVKPS